MLDEEWDPVRQDEESLWVLSREAYKCYVIKPGQAGWS